MAQTFDVVIVGAGPTGLAAALYTAREDLSTLVLEKAIPGGLIATTEHVDNYPGFVEGVGGLELSQNMQRQAERFGAQVKTGVNVESLETTADGLLLRSSEGEFLAKAVLVATGSSYRNLGVPGEAQLLGRGIHHCATCDGPLYRDKHLVIVGGGSTALQEGLFLTKFAGRITMLVRGPQLKGAQVLQHPMTDNPKVEIRYQTTVDSFEETAGRLTAVLARQGQNVERIEADGVFEFIGLLPNTDWLKGSLDLDEQGFIKVSADGITSLPGVFAAGDVQAGSAAQVATAVGEGVAAALAIRRYLDPRLHAH
jgi:thioredoxin reductase (NADPH)